MPHPPPDPRDPDARPYRPNVGIALFRADGRVLIAKRLADDGPEIIQPGFAWQMPQGGVDQAEDPAAAARRELQEETGVVSARIVDVMPEWLTYDFPTYGGPPHRLALFRGQRQLWFAMRFEGDEREITLAGSADAEPEFSEWRWERVEAIADLVVPYKRAIYREVARRFAPLAAGSPRPDGSRPRS